MNIRTIALTYTPLVRRISAVCVAGIVVSLVLYAVFLLEAVAHTATRVQAERAIESVSSQLSSLETQYLSLTRAMTPERAQELGFVPPQQTTTVFDTGGKLSFHESR